MTDGHRPISRTTIDTNSSIRDPPGVGCDGSIRHPNQKRLMQAPKKHPKLPTPVSIQLPPEIRRRRRRRSACVGTHPESRHLIRAPRRRLATCGPLYTAADNSGSVFASGHVYRAIAVRSVLRDVYIRDVHLSED